jgi:hypothetical protein
MTTAYSVQGYMMQRVWSQEAYDKYVFKAMSRTARAKAKGDRWLKDMTAEDIEKAAHMEAKSLSIGWQYVPASSFA